MRDKPLVYLSLAISLIALAISIIGLCYVARFKTPGDIYISQQTKLAKAGNRWAEFHLWDAYAHGTNGAEPNTAKGDQWLRAFVEDVYVVRFAPANGFNPRNATEFLENIHSHAPGWHSDTDGIGVSGFFRTKREGDKLIGSSLTSEPDKLRAYIESNPDLKFISVEPVTPQSFIQYERSIQESLDASVVGVGLELYRAEENGPVKVRQVIPGSPAWKAGIKPGFCIVSIDGTNTEDFSLWECARRIRGTLDTEVTLGVVDPTFYQTNTVTLRRVTIRYTPSR